ncbi:hypothetical protein WDZ92_37255, partial [Nostoc sp. NIES-2111]
AFCSCNRFQNADFPWVILLAPGAAIGSWARRRHSGLCQRVFSTGTGSCCCRQPAPGGAARAQRSGTRSPRDLGLEIARPDQTLDESRAS